MRKERKLFSIIREFAAEVRKDNTGTYAAQASFFIVLSSIPFLMLIFTIINLFIDIDPQAVIHTVSGFAPAKVSEMVSLIIAELFDKSASIPVISVTAASALWLSSRGVMALYTGINHIYHLPGKNYLYERLISVLYTLAFIAVLVLTMIFIGFGSRAEEIIASYSALLSDILHFLFRGKIYIFFIFQTLIFALSYKFLPQKHCKFATVLPGAVFSATGWLVFSFFYSIYIDNFSDYTLVYGSLAAVVLLMLWLYFCMNIFLFGAEINKFIKNKVFEK